MIDNDGRSKVTLFNDMQPENATSPIFVIDLKILICFNFEEPKNKYGVISNPSCDIKKSIIFWFSLKIANCICENEMVSILFIQNSFLFYHLNSFLLFE